MEGRYFSSFRGMEKLKTPHGSINKETSFQSSFVGYRPFRDLFWTEDPSYAFNS